MLEHFFLAVCMYLDLLPPSLLDGAAAFWLPCVAGVALLFVAFYNTGVNEREWQELVGRLHKSRSEVKAGVKAKESSSIWPLTKYALSSSAR